VYGEDPDDHAREGGGVMGDTYGNLYGLLYLPDDDASNLVKTAEEAFTHALAVQRIMRLMLLGLATPEESEDGDEELLSHLSWYAYAWTRKARDLLAAERAAAEQQITEAVEKAGAKAVA
jgi:hypothetical protein